MRSQSNSNADIEQVQYRPPATYRLDLEVFSLAERAKQIALSSVRGTHRIDFHMLICPIRGHFTHTIDFRPYRCQTGSILTIRPAQTQCFDSATGWDAWVILFKPEFLLPLQSATSNTHMATIGRLETLPEHLSLNETDWHAVNGCIEQMHRDAKMNVPPGDLHALLRHQLYALLLRLHIVQGQQEARDFASPATLQRFKRFQQQVDIHFATRHQVSDYAELLGMSEKSLGRATMEVAGMTAKSYVASRVNLEAKRLLVHTTLPVATIADRVGFDEVTNFIKFFKREAGCTPGEFRRRQAQQA